VPVLYLVATPIGNLEDVTLRALRVLKEVSLIAAEDTRTARKLLAHYGIKARLLSYHSRNWRNRIPRILAHLKEGDVALISEAGMPAISDPGQELVASAAAAGFRVVPIPGPSALVTALAVSGIPAREFTFLGFLPRRKKERQEALSRAAAEGRALIFLEAPHRLRAFLQDLLEVMGDRRVAVCRELTKAFEEVFRGKISEALAHFQSPRGEFTVVVEGAPPHQEKTLSEDLLRQEMARLRAQGLRAKEAAAQLSQRFGVPKRLAYRLWLEAEGHTSIR